MLPTTIHAVRRVQFCAGHRVPGHENKCAHIHGHNYVAYFHARAAELDSVGRVIDFSVLKERLGGWIDKHWDHGFIAMDGDYDAVHAVAPFTPRLGVEQKLFLLSNSPTAENMASYLLNVVCEQELRGTGVRVDKVVLWETENCFVEVSRA